MDGLRSRRRPDLKLDAALGAFQFPADGLVGQVQRGFTTRALNRVRHVPRTHDKTGGSVKYLRGERGRRWVLEGESEEERSIHPTIVIARRNEENEKSFAFAIFSAVSCDEFAQENSPDSTICWVRSCR